MARKKATKFVTLEVHTDLSNAKLKKVAQVFLDDGTTLVVVKKKDRDTVAHAITQVTVSKAD